MRLSVRVTSAWHMDSIIDPPAVFYGSESVAITASVQISVIDRSEILRMILFGRTSCRSRSKNNYKILLLTGAQDLLFGQDLLPEQELHIEQEDLLIIMWGYILHVFLSNSSQTTS